MMMRATKACKVHKLGIVKRPGWFYEVTRGGAVLVNFHQHPNDPSEVIAWLPNAVIDFMKNHWDTHRFFIDNDGDVAVDHAIKVEETDERQQA